MSYVFSKTTSSALLSVQEIIHSHMYIAEDYMSEVVKWSNVDHYEQYVRRIQLPFVAAPVSTVSAEQQRERRKEAARRLVELNARKREEKVGLTWFISYRMILTGTRQTVSDAIYFLTPTYTWSSSLILSHSCRRMRQS